MGSGLRTEVSEERLKPVETVARQRKSYVLPRRAKEQKENLVPATNMLDSKIAYGLEPNRMTPLKARP